jgi:hypothetical protein
MSSHGFRIDFAGWDLSGCDAKLRQWAGRFFEDHAWVGTSSVLLGWLKESHTVPGVRDVVHHYLTYWQCTKRRRYMKGWVVQVSPAEFHQEAGRTPRPVHEANVQMLREILMDVVDQSAALGARRAKVLKRAREDDAECCARAFKALRRNAPSVQSSALEAARARLALLESHLQELALLRAAAADRCIHLPDNWDSVAPGQLHERVGRRGLMLLRHSAETIRLIHGMEAEREEALRESLRAEVRRLE